MSGSGLGSEETDLGIAPLFAGPTQNENAEPLVQKLRIAREKESS